MKDQLLLFPPSHSISLRLILAIAGTLLAPVAPAATVTGWQLIFDGDSDSSFTGGTAATASPVIADAHKSSIAANFPTVTLADGDSLVLTGTVSFPGALANGQFRFGLFDGDNLVTAGDGTGYVGFYAEAPSSGGVASVTSNDGTNTDHPFSTPGTIADLGTMSDPGVTPAANTVLDFSLTLTRNGANVDVSTSVTDGGSYSTSASFPGTTAVPGNLTYDSAAFLVGGSTGGEWNNVDAAFSNIDVSVIPEPTAAALLGLVSALTLLRRRRD